jgi:outer membrane autotransporter protein
VTVGGGGTLDLAGFSQAVLGITNAGLVNMGMGTTPGNLLTTNSYIGTGGTIAMNAFLGADNSPSDKLIINGGSATGSSFLRITNAGGPGAQTMANGIPVVQAINGGTTAPAAFTLAGEARGGAFDYFLFRGGLGGSSPNDWFLRSTFIVGPMPPDPPILPPTLPTDPAPDPLPPGVFPIVGPSLATLGVVQPIARQLGMTTLGTLHERTGDTSLIANTGSPCPAGGKTGDGIVRKAPTKAPTDCLNAGWSPSAWGRVIGQHIDNRYRAFADPRASGQLLGFQSGIDLWRGEWLPGHRDAAGIYFAYANANVEVTGRVTNEAATNYVLRRTGGLNLDAWSGAAYWTHYGPGDWYLDAVAQATHYQGAATTQFAGLATTGFGFVSSLEAGYPIRLPMFGPGFVLEPQAQVVWQRVSFDIANDGLGEVALGTTSGASGRIGLRGKWTVVSDSGQVWQPYVRANLWRDWGARATAIYSGVDLVSLLEQANRLQLGGGVSVRMNANVSLYANADYQISVGDTDGGRRDGIRGAAGVRFMW